MDPVHILHLSDLHFGPNSRFARRHASPQPGYEIDAKHLAAVVAQAVEEERKRRSIAPRVGVVVVTGDIAQAAKRVEYQTALDFFRELASRLDLPPTRFVFTPGNHDVSWAECNKAVQDQESEGFDDAELRKRMDAAKFRFYHEFRGEFLGKPSGAGVTPFIPDAFLHRFDDLHLSVAAVNSCEVESHREVDHPGQVSREQALSLMGLWKAEEPDLPLRLIALHHHPVTTVPSVVGEWLEELRRLRVEGKLDEATLRCFAADLVGFPATEHLEKAAKQCRAQVLLHGHHHAPGLGSWPWGDGHHTTVLSAGSWGLEPRKLPQDQPNTLQLVLLDPKAGQLRGYRLRYDPTRTPEGEVAAGHFVPDSGDYGAYEELIYVPKPPARITVGATLAPGEVRVDTAQDAAFLERFRARLGPTYAAWDLRYAGVAQPQGTTQPIAATLRDMYVPLRFHESYDAGKTDQGEVLLPEALLGRKPGLLLRGPAGSGKTTWMRWAFLELLQRDDVLPVMVVLRKVAAHWREHRGGAQRSFDACLERWAEEEMGADYQAGALSRLVASKSGARPVLLIDGWDELGAGGDEFRRKLAGFLKAHPRVLAIATSRPYAEGMPSAHEGFEQAYLQPLNDADIESLARRFFRHCYGEAGTVLESSVAALQGALKASAGAASLARTPLLLTMLLLIHRSRPLPEGRHELYQACIENLLAAIPRRREEEGTELLSEQWRPEDPAERRRAAAALAFGLQSGSRGDDRGGRPIVRPWNEMRALLPGGWDAHQRDGFLSWLLGGSGLLTDYTDGSLSFAHLSFQEYLAALHLDRLGDGEEKRWALWREHTPHQPWWETLRLWGAILQGRGAEYLDPVLSLLLEDARQGVWLAGALLADGLGGRRHRPVGSVRCRRPSPRVAGWRGLLRLGLGGEQAGGG